MQQAEMDLEAAKKGLSNPSYDAFNWICFICHQAAEKALKAMLYNNDAELADQIRCHDLRSIARNLQCGSIDDLLSLVERFEALGCDYYRMRYPDRLSFPRIPFSLYSQQTASEACRHAEDIVCYAKRHMP
ncbi:sacsin-like [Gigantopelta aegis]|uniref:sacsin-like n=1 Tax=Gigantopelta aegis TaxID=1735272 RepID=UPI001B88C254|nr:sacsin-like [Gigantopelta aegis]